MANRTVLVKDIDVFLELLVTKGFSYRQLAKEAKTSQTSISLIVKGERNPSPNTAVNICRALGCRFEDIFFINNDYKSNQEQQENK